MKKICLFFFLVICKLSSVAQGSDSAGIKKADQLIKRLGGHEVWAGAKYLYAKENVNRLTISGNISAEFWRDYTKPGYREKIIGEQIDFEECRDAKQGWTSNKGKVSKMADEDLAEEWKGSQQEPYKIYYRIAKKDPDLIIKIVGENRLDFYEKNGRKLCWIIVDKDAAPVSWGNIYRGRLNQHLYGPLKKFGEVNMPSWGISIDANFRFEYVEVRLVKEDLVLPCVTGN